MTWIVETGQYALKHKRWPNPFTNMVRDIEVIACEDTFQAKIKMYGSEFGDWFFSQIVPSPVEIFRKTMTGGYKCGFYIPLKIRSPLDIVWKDKIASKLLAEVHRPVLTGFFFIWAAETVLDALSRWQTLQYAMQMCEADRRECLMMGGKSPLAIGHNDGGAALSTVLWDPLNIAQETDTAINVQEPVAITMNAFGFLVSDGCTINNAEVYMFANGVEVANQSLGSVGPGQVVPFSLAISGNYGVGTVQPRIRGDVTGSALAPPVFRVDRFTGRLHAPAVPHYGNLPSNDPPCKQPQQKLIEILGLG